MSKWSSKTNPGNHFEDFQIGQKIIHPTPRTITEGDKALYQALYPVRNSLYSSVPFAEQCGLNASPINDMMVFHIVFGKTVPDVSLNAVANLGYAEVRFFRFVYTGDTLRSESKVIGLKENSNHKSGIVWIKTTGYNQNDEIVLSYIRWVMVLKKSEEIALLQPIIPTFEKEVMPSSLVIPNGLHFTNYGFQLAGEKFRLSDYSPGETINHVDGVTLEEAEHMMATRLWQNTARVHFDATYSRNEQRLIYGGHLISMARALTFNGLANAQCVAAINSGSHVNPCYAGNTVRAWSEIIDIHDLQNSGMGAIRIKTSVTKGEPGKLKDESGKYEKDILLDMDYWCLAPV